MMMFQADQLLSQVDIPYSVNKIKKLPDALGFAGMYAGTVHGDLLVAGGANFPDKMPWEGGAKYWYDDIYVLAKGEVDWMKLAIKLPAKLGYGVTVSTENGIVLIGGSDDDNVPSDQVSCLYKENAEWKIKTLAPIPTPLANMCGELVDDYVFVAGGTIDVEGNVSSAFYAYDIKNNVWKELGNVPGPKRINAISSMHEGAFYVFSGIEFVKQNDGGLGRNILTDAYRYTPTFQKGQIVGGTWQGLAEMPRGLAAGPVSVPVVNNRQILFFGGLDQKTAQYSDPKTHPGFLPEVFAYDLQEDSWEIVGQLPKNQMRLTLPGLLFGDDYLLINGEVAPGVRTNTILSIDLNKLNIN